MSWQTVRAYLRANFELLGDEHGAIALAWTFPTDHGGEVIQHQWLVPVTVMGTHHVSIVCPVVAEGRMSLREALRHNNTLAVGGLALVDDTYVLRTVLPLDTLTAPALRRALELVGHEAARLRERCVVVCEDQPGL